MSCDTWQGHTDSRRSSQSPARGCQKHPRRCGTGAEQTKQAAKRRLLWRCMLRLVGSRYRRGPRGDPPAGADREVKQRQGNGPARRRARFTRLQTARRLSLPVSPPVPVSHSCLGVSDQLGSACEILTGGPDGRVDWMPPCQKA